jgi:hypothetical protein
LHGIALDLIKKEEGKKLPFLSLFLRYNFLSLLGFFLGCHFYHGGVKQ